MATAQTGSQKADQHGSTTIPGTSAMAQELGHRIACGRAHPRGQASQYVHEARALDAADMKVLKHDKRYALMVLLFHAQLSKSLDDAVEIFIRKLRKIHTGAEEQLRQYYLEHQKRAEKLIIQLRDVLEAFVEGETDEDRCMRIAAAFHDEPGNLLVECDEHIAYAGDRKST